MHVDEFVNCIDCVSILCSVRCNSWMSSKVHIKAEVMQSKIRLAVSTDPKEDRMRSTASATLETRIET